MVIWYLKTRFQYSLILKLGYINEFYFSNIGLQRFRSITTFITLNFSYNDNSSKYSQLKDIYRSFLVVFINLY